MYGLSLSAAKREIEVVGWETLHDVAFLRGVAHTKCLVETTDDESKLPKDKLTALVMDVIGEQLVEELEERKRKAGVT